MGAGQVLFASKCKTCKYMETKMKPNDKIKYVGESIYGLKNQIGKIVNEMTFFNLMSNEKYWEVDFEDHVGTYLCKETDLKVESHQLEFNF
jgi:hypothetical protein